MTTDFFFVNVSFLLKLYLRLGRGGVVIFSPEVPFLLGGKMLSKSGKFTVLDFVELGP